MQEANAPDAAVETLDGLADELQVLRASAGLSYRALALLIAAQREQDGVSQAAARIAHTTVSDAFRRGRSRINAELVAEIVRAMGGDRETADAWRRRCVRAIARMPRDDDAPRAVAVPQRPARARGAGRVIPVPRQLIWVVVVGGVLLNATGKFLNPLAGDLLFLDMIGTAVAALLLGPWWAALTGILFVSVQLLKGDIGGALFAVTMITAGLIWGYGAQRFGMARTLPRFLALSGIVAVVTSALAVPITVLYYGGSTGRGADAVVAWATGEIDVWAAVGVTNIALSLTDKVLTGAIAYGVARVISRAPAFTVAAVETS